MGEPRGDIMFWFKFYSVRNIKEEISVGIVWQGFQEKIFYLTLNLMQWFPFLKFIQNVQKCDIKQIIKR